MVPKSGLVAPRAATLEKPLRLLPGRYPGQRQL